MGCETLKNTGNGNSRCYIGVIVGGFFSQEQFNLSKTNILLEAQWNTKLLANKPARVYPLFDVDNPQMVAQRAPRNYTPGSGRNIYLGSSNMSLSIDINSPAYYELRNKLLSGIGDADGYIMWVTSEGYIFGREKSDGNIEGISVNVTKTIMEAEGYTVPQILKFTFTEKTPDADLENIYSCKPTAFNPLTKTGIVDITLEQISASATTLVIKATVAGSGGTIPIADFVAAAGADWQLAGDTISNAVYSSTTGYYTLTATAAADGDVLTLTAPVTSLKFYETPVGLTIDVN